MTKKRIISYILLLVVFTTLISTLTGCTTSEKVSAPKESTNQFGGGFSGGGGVSKSSPFKGGASEKDIYIYDENNIINNDVEENLNKMLIELEEKTEIEFVVVAVESLLNKSIEEYANSLFNTLGIGKNEKDNGVLLLFSQSDKKVRLEIGRGLEGCLNASKCGRILNDYFIPYLKNDDYTKATEMTVKAVLNVIDEEYGIGIQSSEENVSAENSSNIDSLWSYIKEGIIIILKTLAFMLILTIICFVRELF